MHKNWRVLIARIVGVFPLSAGLVLSGCGDTEPPATSSPSPQVVVETAKTAALPLNLTYTARTAGSREVEVRARVSGILQQRLYQEGAWVREGAPLFLIDPEPFKAAVARAKADLALQRAKEEQARRDRERIVPLFEKGLASTKERDDAISNFDIAAASTQAAEAALRTAELELDYAQVRAPISGLTSRESRSEGSLLTADTDSSLLTRIVQVQPLYIDFALPEQEAALLRTQLAAPGAQVKVHVSFADGEQHSEAATLTFIDNAVDADSGAVNARAVLANRDNRLLPGQFVRVSLSGVTVPDVVAIPRKAVLTTSQGYKVWVVDDNNVVQPRLVQLGRSESERAVIAAGLQDGERFVVEGVLKVQPGVTVTPMNLLGGVRQAAEQDSGGGASPATASRP